MPAFEWVHVQLHQQKGMISLSPPTICNSAGGLMLGMFPVRVLMTLLGAVLLISAIKTFKHTRQR
ncbi:hypothetical protein EAD90_24810 [Salmonella enterica subsp. enterica]|nr:hypothetical protein [Salmonella enterica subsp. enterica]